MRLYTLIMIFLNLIFGSINAQEDKKSFAKGDFVIKYCPTSLLDYQFPKIEFAATYLIDNKLAVQLKIGKKVDIFHSDDEFKYEGFKVALEYQYFIFRKLYASIENGLIKNHFTDEMTYLISQGSTNRIGDQYDVADEKLFIVPKAGFLIFIKSNFCIEFYAGVGLEYVNRTVQELEFNPGIGHIDTSFYEWFGPTYNERQEFAPRFTLGIRIGLRLN